MSREKLIEDMARAFNETLVHGSRSYRQLSESDYAYAWRAALAIAERAIAEEWIEKAAGVADEECEVMLSQRDEIIGNGVLGHRSVPKHMRKGLVYERKVLAEGFEGLAAAIRALPRPGEER